MGAVIRCLFLLSMLVPLAGLAQLVEEVPRPDVRVGDRWTYRHVNPQAKGPVTIEVQVTFVDERSIVGFSTNQKKERESDGIWTPDWNAVSSPNGMAYRPSSGLLQFPLFPGKQYHAAYEAERPRDGRGISRVSRTVVVVGWETVEVPAGKFRVLRVEATNDGSKGGPQVIAWYSPEVKRWVRLRVIGGRAQRDDVLLSYKLN